MSIELGALTRERITRSRFPFRKYLEGKSPIVGNCFNTREEFSKQSCAGTQVDDGTFISELLICPTRYEQSENRVGKVRLRSNFLKKKTRIKREGNAVPRVSICL